MWRAGSRNSIKLWQDVLVGELRLVDGTTILVPHEFKEENVAATITDNFTWDITKLSLFLPRNIIN